MTDDEQKCPVGFRAEEIALSRKYPRRTRGYQYRQQRQSGIETGRNALEAGEVFSTIRPPTSSALNRTAMMATKHPMAAMPTPKR